MKCFIPAVPLSPCNITSSFSRPPVLLCNSSPPVLYSLQKDLDIASVGNLCLDIVLPVSSFPIISGKHQRLTSGSQLELGGSLNALISARRLGARAAPIAYISKPDTGVSASDLLLSNYIREEAARVGLETSALVPRSNVVVPTCAAICDPAGTHTFLASNELPQDEGDEEGPIIGASESMLSAVRRSKVLVVDGFALHSDRQLVKHTVTAAKAAGTKVWVDPQSAAQSLTSSHDELFRFVMNCAEGVSLTMDEAEAMTGKTSPDEVSSALFCDWCPSATTILVKDGENGSHVTFCESGTEWFENVWAPGFSIPVGDYKDSIGAGDSFLGAFLAGLVSNRTSVVESAILGNAMGAATCMQHGAGVSGVGTHRSVMSLMGDSHIARRFEMEAVRAV